jgi:hypothetical protein
MIYFDQLCDSDKDKILKSLHDWSEFQKAPFRESWIDNDYDDWCHVQDKLGNAVKESFYLMTSDINRESEVMRCTDIDNLVRILRYILSKQMIDIGAENSS